MELSIIIVNYNVKFFLEQCLHSVMRAIKNIDAEVFVVDNNSTDGSKLFFNGKFNTVTFIWNDKNWGFAKANNAALPKATGKYVLFLNPDTLVPEDCFTKCIAFMESKPGAGALGIHMIDGSGKFLKESKRSFPSPFTSLYKLSGLSKLFPRSKRFTRYHLGYMNENTNNEVDVLSGAFFITSKLILNTIGSFDEDFFMYGEDIDLSYRIQKAGYKNWYYAESTIIHFKGGSTQKETVKYVRMFYKAMSIFVNKHYGAGKAGLFNFLIQFAILTRASISLAGRFVRRLVVKTDLLKRALKEEQRPTFIAGTTSEYVSALTIMRQMDIKGEILGRVSVDKEGGTAIGDISEILFLLEKHGIKQIILCQGKLSFKEIIEVAKKIPRHVKVKFFTAASEGIIGNNDQNTEVL